MLQADGGFRLVLSLAARPFGPVGFNDDLLLEVFGIGFKWVMGCAVRLSLLFLVFFFLSARCLMTKASTMKITSSATFVAWSEILSRHRLMIIRWTALWIVPGSEIIVKKLPKDLIIEPIDQVIPLTDRAGGLGVSSDKRIEDIFDHGHGDLSHAGNVDVRL